LWFNDMKGAFVMVLHGLLVKAAPTVVTGAVGVAAYGALRKGVAKFPLRAATVTVTAWGIRAAREAERKAQQSAEQARLTAADVIAEAKERIGEDVTPLVVVDSGNNDAH
jgi:chaperone-like protein